MSNSQISELFDLYSRKLYPDALNLANSIISRNPTISSVQSLKCDILFKLGRKNDALDYAKQLTSNKDLDHVSLRRLEGVFKLCGHPEEICPIKEQQFVQNPTEDNARELFLSYVHAGISQKQTQV